jgi:hypothetical protein
MYLTKSFSALKGVYIRGLVRICSSVVDTYASTVPADGGAVAYSWGQLDEPCISVVVVLMAFG